MRRLFLLVGLVSMCQLMFSQIPKLHKEGHSVCSRITKGGTLSYSVHRMLKMYSKLHKWHIFAMMSSTDPDKCAHACPLLLTYCWSTIIVSCSCLTFSSSTDLLYVRPAGHCITLSCNSIHAYHSGFVYTENHLSFKLYCNLSLHFSKVKTNENRSTSVSSQLWENPNRFFPSLLTA